LRFLLGTTYGLIDGKCLGDNVLGFVLGAELVILLGTTDGFTDGKWLGDNVLSFVPCVALGST